MKKNLLLFVFLVFCSYKLYCQAYNDAVYLRQNHFNTTVSKIILDSATVPILKKYFHVKNLTPDDSMVKKNPFLNNMFVVKGISAGFGAGTMEAAKFSFSSLSGLDVTTIANGIAEFMIKRAKEELTVAFFERFKKFSEEHQEFQILFPKTADNLSNLLSFHYPEMLPTLRNGFYEDLKNFIFRFDDLLQLPKFQSYFKDFPEIVIAIRSIDLIQKLQTAYHPADIIKKFASFPEWKSSNGSEQFKNCGNAIRLASIFSESLRGDDGWISIQQFEDLIEDEITFKIYLGLVYQQIANDSIQFSVKGEIKYFTDIMSAQKDNLILFESGLNDFIQMAHEVTDLKNGLSNKSSTSTNEDYYSYVNSSINIIEYAFNIANLFDSSVHITEYSSIARKANDLYRNIYQEQYSQAIINATDILSKLNDIVKNKRGSSLLNEDVVAGITKYGLFMANIVDAKNSADVGAILESSVLPVGSSSVKKYSDFNISIQSYLGAFYRFGSLEHNTNSAWSDRWGVIAPIGLSFNHGFGKKGSLGVFTSLLDVGAVVDYQLKNDSVASANGDDSAVVKKDYHIELGQIFSPGAYVVYGCFGHIPLALGVGGQYGPGFGKIHSDGNAVVNSSQWRWNIFLAVDIPFFTVVNKNKTYKRTDQ